MAIAYDAPVTPDALTAFIREAPLPAGLSLLSLFPVVRKPTNTVNFSDITRTNRTARYRAFDGRIHVADRDGYSDKVIAMPAFSDALNMGEYERLQIEFQRTGGTRGEALANAIYNDAERLVGYMQNRMNLAIGDVLTDGKLTVNLASEFGGETDFGVPAGNLITVGTAWSTVATANGFSDLLAACDAYEALNGSRPGAVITRRANQRLLRTQTPVINAVKGSAAGVSRVQWDDLSDLLASEGIPTDWRIVEDSVDVDGSQTYAIPADKVILAPADLGDLLEFQMGVSATALELVNDQRSDMTFNTAAGIVGVVEKVGPPYRQFTYVDAVGMPILKDARKLMVLDVAP